MAHKIVIAPLAHLDELEAYEWYENERTGLGEELLTELENAYNKIAAHSISNYTINVCPLCWKMKILQAV